MESHRRFERSKDGSRVKASCSKFGILAYGSLACLVSTRLMASDPADAPADERNPTVIVVGVTPLQGADMDRRLIAAPVQTATAEQIERSHALDLSAFMSRSIGGVYINDIQNNPLQTDLRY